MDILTFMGNHPWLTFFLALILADCIIKSARAIRGQFIPCECKCCEDESTFQCKVETKEDDK